MFICDDAADIAANDMISIVTMENVVYFYYSFGSYGYGEYETEMFRWILLNFSYWHETVPEAFINYVLSHMESVLLETLITNEDFIVKNEFVLYSILKRWTVDKVKTKENYDYFKVWGRPEAFLQTEEGREFERIYSLLNLHYLIMDQPHLEIVRKDNIIPEEWLYNAGAENYLYMSQLNDPPMPKLKTFQNDPCRIAIFHNHGASSFNQAHLDYFGIPLIFGWSDKRLTVTRYRRTDEIFYQHGPVTLRFRVCFYTPEKFRKDKSYQKVPSIDHTLTERHQINLLEWNTDDMSLMTKFPSYTPTSPIAYQPNPSFGLQGSYIPPARAPIYIHNSIHYYDGGIVINSTRFPKIIGIEISFVNQINQSLEIIPDDYLPSTSSGIAHEARSESVAPISNTPIDLTKDNDEDDNAGQMMCIDQMINNIERDLSDSD